MLLSKDWESVQLKYYNLFDSVTLAITYDCIPFYVVVSTIKNTFLSLWLVYIKDGRVKD